jgi:hypothetical protein
LHPDPVFKAICGGVTDSISKAGIKLEELKKNVEQALERQKRRTAPDIWYNYSNSPYSPTLPAGKWVTNNGNLSYSEAISITFQEFKGGPVYKHTVVVPPGGVCPIADLRTGMRQGVTTMPLPTKIDIIFPPLP